MITIHWERLKDYYKLNWDFICDKEIEKACNSIIENRNKTRDIYNRVIVNTSNKQTYLNNLK